VIGRCAEELCDALALALVAAELTALDDVVADERAPEDGRDETVDIGSVVVGEMVLVAPVPLPTPDERLTVERGTVAVVLRGSEFDVAPEAGVTTTANGARDVVTVSVVCSFPSAGPPATISSQTASSLPDGTAHTALIPMDRDGMARVSAT
jgi:hypothetical protein